MLDFSQEKPLTFAAVSRGHPTHPSVPTVWRWALKGLQGVRLESLKIGGRRFTSLEAIDRFAARLTEPRPVEELGASKRRQQEMIQSAERAEAVFGGHS